jgi:hypothetical protein
MNDQDYNKQFGQEPDFSGVRVAIAMVLLVAVTLIALWATFAVAPVKAAETCPIEAQEARITEAITPQDTVWTFTGAGLNAFLSSVAEWGLMAGRPINVDKVYVTKDDKANHTIFFLYRACIVYAAHGPSSVMDRILPT